MSVDIRRALKISEYQCQERTDELTWLAEQASRSAKIVEVGCWQGCSTLAMAANTQGMVYAVDTFLGSPELMERMKAFAPGNDLFTQFMRNVGDFRNVYVKRMTSLEAAESLKEERFDLLFLDANHSYESVREDLLAWMPLLNRGGIASGHDRQWDGVKAAIDELLPGHKVAVGAIWYIEA